jgi:P27 family predicted phage terminase small subunit
VSTRGRKPTPTALKVVRGETRPSRLNKNEPKHAPRAPGCPSWLRPEAKAEWRRVVPELDRVGMLARVDRAALTAYCVCWALMVEADRDVQEHGVVLEEGKRNPSLLTAKDMATQVRLFAAEFGLTPSSRARMDAPVAPPAAGGGPRAADRFLS